MCRRKLTVPAGVFVHEIAGDVCSPACVYFAGMSAPSAKPVTVITMGFAAGAPP
jgi:hypothetical protein